MRTVKYVLLVCWGCFLVGVESLQAQPQYGGDVTYPEFHTVAVFNPYDVEIWGPIEDRVYTLFYEPLFRWNFHRQRMEPALAENWEPKDGRRTNRITINLRRGVKWHNGETFTAEDVAFTFNYLLQSNNKSAINQYNELIQSVQIEDEFTVTIYLKQAISEPERLIAAFWVIPSSCFDGRMIANQECNIRKNPVGTGFYRFVNRDDGGNIQLTVNQDYWDDRAYIDTIKMEQHNDPTSVYFQTRSGQLQFLVETPLDKVQEFDDSPDFDVEPYPSFAIYAIAHNPQNEILAMREFREVIGHAINREELLNNWYEGYGDLIGGPVVPSHPYYNRDVKPVDFYPAHTERILDGLGFKDNNGDGYRETPDGKILRFRMAVKVLNPGEPSTDQNVAEAIRNNLSKVGIDVKIEYMQADMFEKTVINDRNFDMAYIRWEFSPQYDISTFFWGQYNYPGGNNIVQYNNPSVNALFERFHNAEDTDEKLLTIRSIQAIIAGEQPYTFLYTVDLYATFHRSITKSRIDPFFFFTYFNQWYYSP